MGTISSLWGPLPPVAQWSALVLCVGVAISFGNIEGPPLRVVIAESSGSIVAVYIKEAGILVITSVTRVRSWPISYNAHDIFTKGSRIVCTNAPPSMLVDLVGNILLHSLSLFLSRLISSAFIQASWVRFLSNKRWAFSLSSSH